MNPKVVKLKEERAKNCEKMRREYAKQQNEGPTLSLDSISASGEIDEAAWLADTMQDIDADMLWAEEKAAFCNTLTANAKQRNV